MENRKDADTAQIYSRIVERYAMFFDRPEERLRFLNNTLSKQADRQARLQRSFQRFRFLEQTRVYDWVLEARCYSAILEEMRAMYSALPKERRKLTRGIQAPFSARLFFLLHQTRHAFYSVAAILTLLALVGLYTFGAWSLRGVNTLLATRYGKSSASGQTSSPPDTSAKGFPGYKPEKVWFVEREGEYEKWSNGCRISTKYETGNHPRAYYTIPRGSESNGDQARTEVAGIVYHTPESDMVDFVPNNNKEIKARTLALLEYIRDRKLYNYLIDRYGNIYRLVRDEHAAKHAGDSLWADAKNTYVLLNESFIGVCFESKFDGATSLDQILTKAQISSGRELTEVLRNKYSIDDANCTTHGLVAVDPAKMLIARHHDWVSNFPFEEMGLSDKYKVQPPNMIDYGFTYDEDVLAKIGKLWEGAARAEEEFKKRAERARVDPDVLRRKLRDRYILQRNKTIGLRARYGDANNPRLAEKSFAAGQSMGSGNNQPVSAASKTTN